MSRIDLGARMERTLAQVRVSTGAALAFGGPVSRAGTLLLERFDGRTSGALPGLTLETDEGLGGKAVATRQSVAVDDYFDTQAITHRFDSIIRAERICSVVATPIVVGREPVAVIYGAFRTACNVSGSIRDAVAHEARALEQELAVAASRGASPALDATTEIARLREQIRDIHRELRITATASIGPEARQVVERISARLLDTVPAGPPISLTSREIDVLTLASSGMSNQQIAAILGLTLHTVKSYMKSALRKLGASSRLEAVVLARRSNLIP